jgi:hypothetical protein
MPLLSVTYIQGWLQVCCSVSRIPVATVMNKGQFPYLLYASRILPDNKMESTVKRKLSLGTFLWPYGRTFCHIWTIMCRECDTQCVSQGQQTLIFKNLFGMITEWSPTFLSKHSNNRMSLRYYRPTLSCSVHITRTVCKRQTVKWSVSSLGRHSKNLACG